MANFWTLIMIAALGGVAVTLQGHFMGAMSKQFSMESVLITYGSGGLTIGGDVSAARLQLGGSA